MAIDEYYEQHPIPQQVSAYQFKLVGDMTLKQFFQVAGGVLISILIYSSGLPAYVKWPLIVLSFLFGVALAFFPLEDRPLAKWISLFMKAIYSPTVYIWRSSATKLIYFQPEPELAPTTLTAPQEAIVTQEFKEEKVPAEFERLEKGEQEFLTNVSQHFDAPLSDVAKPVTTKVPITVPKVATPSIMPEEKSTPIFEQTFVQTQTGFTPSPMRGQKTINIQTAKFSQEAAPPNPPTKPNLVVGQVVDPQGKIVEAAIIEIRDAEGRPVRALKSNKLGHFMIVTPLSNGNYEIITEKEEYTFEPISFEAKDQIIPPIAILAKNL